MYLSTKLLSLNISFAEPRSSCWCSSLPWPSSSFYNDCSFVGFRKTRAILSRADQLHAQHWNELRRRVVQTVLARRSNSTCPACRPLECGNIGLTINFQAMHCTLTVPDRAFGAQAAVVAQIYRAFMIQAAALSF